MEYRRERRTDPRRRRRSLVARRVAGRDRAGMSSHSARPLQCITEARCIDRQQIAR